MKIVDASFLVKTDPNPPTAMISYETIEEGKKYYACYSKPPFTEVRDVVEVVNLTLITPQGVEIVYHAVELQAPPENVDWIVIG